MLYRCFHSALVAAVLAAPLLMLGCGGGPKFAPVTGTLTQNAKPLNNVRIEFWPTADGPKSTAVTDDQGRFTLKTEDGKQEGAMLGTHKIILKDLIIYGDQFLGRKAENMADLSGGKKPRFAQAQYRDSTATPLSKTVAEGPNSFDIDIK